MNMVLQFRNHYSRMSIITFSFRLYSIESVQRCFYWLIKIVITLKAMAQME